MKDSLDPIRKALLEAEPVRDVPSWRFVTQRAIGGLWAVGFERKSETLLAVSSQGQGVIDCTTGELISRNREENGYNLHKLQATRLDTLKSDPIDMCGIDGGGLRSSTVDGWTVDSFPIEWPETHYILQPPGASIYFHQKDWRDHKKDASFYLLERSSAERRAFGFSWTGKTLIWADGSDLYIWNRS